MKRTLKRTLAMLIAVFIVFTSLSCLCVNAENESSADASAGAEAEAGENLEDGSMSMDVVFALDASASMLESDPNRIAVDAYNLFVDLLDESCGVGYAVYNQNIIDSSSILELSDSNLKKLKSKMNGIKYDPYGDTDIALGLTKSMNILDEKKSDNKNRKKAIILLSDGNTHLYNGPRTVDESKKEMEQTIKSLKSKGIPVYSIGLNYDGTLDKKEVEKISNGTDGKSYEAKASSELPEIVFDIFSDIYKVGGREKKIRDGDVQITVKDNSVFYVSIIIRTALTVKELNPTLKDPDGNEVDLYNNSENIKLNSTGSYTMIKMMYPKSGMWTLHLENATNQNCRITQLDFYSVYVRQALDKEAYVGYKYKLTSSLNSGTGIVDDLDLLRTIKMSATITGKDFEKTVNLLSNGNGWFTGEITFDQPGEYTITTHATSEKFEKESLPFTIKAVEGTPPPEIQTSDSGEATPTDDGGAMNFIFRLLLGAIIVVVVIVIAVVAVLTLKNHLKEKAEQQRLAPPPPPPEPKPAEPKPRPRPMPPEKPIKVPEATDPDYVNIPLLEHDALENLIKKGTDDAFSTKSADQYQTDEALESIVRKGTDDAFSAKNADQYQTDEALESIVRKGSDDAFSSQNADSFQTDEALESIIRKGSDDAFSTKNADQYQTDASLDRLIRKGTEDPFNSKADDYQTDPSLAGLIRTGGDGLADGQQNLLPEEMDGQENGEQEDDYR